jgi:hypothetical protein
MRKAREERLTFFLGVRLTSADKTKLERLCRYTRRDPSDLIRCLIRLAEPSAGTVLPLEFTPARGRQAS